MASTRSSTLTHALAWTAAGWRTKSVNLEAEILTFVRDSEPADGDTTRAAIEAEPVLPVSIDDIFTPHDFGPWPEGFRCSREEIYGNDGR